MMFIEFKKKILSRKNKKSFREIIDLASPREEGYNYGFRDMIIEVCEAEESNKKLKNNVMESLSLLKNKLQKIVKSMLKKLKNFHFIDYHSRENIILYSFYDFIIHTANIPQEDAYNTPLNELLLEHYLDYTEYCNFNKFDYQTKDLKLWIKN